MLYTRITIVLLLLLTFSCKAEGQKLFVEEAKQAKLSNNKKLKEGDSISIKEFITITKKGSVRLRNYTGWTIVLGEGRHSIDSSYQHYKKYYASFDSAFTMIREAYPNGLEEAQYNYYCKNCLRGTHDANEHKVENIYFSCLEYGNIKGVYIDNNTNPVQLSWKDPLKKATHYFVVVRNIFGDIIDYKIVNSNPFSIDLDRNKETFYLVTLYSNDMRRSEELHLIRRRNKL